MLELLLVIGGLVMVYLIILRGGKSRQNGGTRRLLSMGIWVFLGLAVIASIRIRGISFTSFELIIVLGAMVATWFVGRLPLGPLRATVVALVVGVAVAGYYVVPISGPPRTDDVAIPSPRDECGDLLIIGVRGSGATAESWEGYGAVVQEFRSWLDLHLSGSKDVQSIPLDYTAEGIGALVTPAFFESFEEGADELTKVIRSSLDDCDDRILVLAGHSQGAAVIHMALPTLFPQERAMISHAVLFSDPARVVGDPENQGLGGGADGSFLAVGGTLPSFPPDINVESWCFADDLVCSFSNNPVSLGLFINDTTTYHSRPYLDIGKTVALRVALDISG